MYSAFKHTHMLMAILSVSLFILRFVWLMRESAQLKRKWVKVLPHVIDTLLLLTAIGLLIQIPWYQHAWLWEKLILVVCYIGFGFVTLKFAKQPTSQRIAFVSAMVCVLGIVHLAFHKTPFFLG